MDYDLADLQRMVQKFCEDREWDQFHGPKDLAIGLVTESCELLDRFRYKSPEECLDLFKGADTRERVEDELADTFFILLRFAQLYDIDLVRAFTRKLEKNAAKYPIEKARGSNRKYDE